MFLLHMCVQGRIAKIRLVAELAFVVSAVDIVFGSSFAFSIWVASIIAVLVVVLIILIRGLSTLEWGLLWR
jgi:hypothetical protein